MESDNKNTNGKPPSELTKKRQVNRKWNSTLLFQIGLIVSIVAVGLAIEYVKFETIKHTPNTLTDSDDVVYTLDAFIIEVDAPKVEEPIPEVTPKTSTRIDKVIEVKDNIPTVETTIDTKDPVVNNPVATNPVVEATPEEKIIIVAPVETPPTKVTMISVEVAPIFPGCEGINNKQQSIACLTQKLHAFIGRKFDTEIASRENLKGQQRIFCSFTIDAQGKIVNIQTRAVNAKLAAEANRVLASVPTLTPAKQGQEKVSVDFSIPIIFDVKN